MTDEGKPVSQVLSERGSRYGDFTHHAEKTEALLAVLESTDSWKRMAPFQRQALRTICDKLARLSNGDPHYDDNWRDIAGYATLVLERLAVEKKGIIDKVRDTILGSVTKTAPSLVDAGQAEAKPSGLG